MLLVAGGWDGSNSLSSTELQVTRGSAWKEVAPYPLAVYGLRGATINNLVYMTGQDCHHLTTLHQVHCHCRRISWWRTIFQQNFHIQTRKWWMEICRQHEDEERLPCSVCCRKKDDPPQLLINPCYVNKYLATEGALELLHRVPLTHHRSEEHTSEL